MHTRLQCTMYIVDCTFYTVHCTINDCTLYIYIYILCKERRTHIK